MTEHDKNNNQITTEAGDKAVKEAKTKNFDMYDKYDYQIHDDSGLSQADYFIELVLNKFKSRDTTGDEHHDF